MLICLGSYFDDPSFESEVNEFSQSGGSISLPIYYFNNMKQENELITNFTGIENGFSIKTLNGIRIAFLNENSQDSSSVLTFDDLNKQFSDDFAKGIDILVSSNWPEGILNGCALQPKDLNFATSKLTAALALHLKPRYHFTNHSVYFERLPYLNKYSNGVDVHATRFLSIAPFLNVAQEKSLYAFNFSTNNTIPPGTSENPFTIQPVVENPTKKQKVVEEKKYDPNLIEQQNSNVGFNIWNLSKEQQQSASYQKKPYQKNPNHHQNQNQNQNNQNSRPKPKPNPRDESCWFCLSNPNCEFHLVKKN